MANAAIRLYKGSDTDKRVGINVVNTAFTSTGLTGDTAIPAALTVNDNWSGTKGIGITFPNPSNSTPELRGLIDINRTARYGGAIRFTEFNENSNGGLSGGKEVYSLPLPNQGETATRYYNILTEKNPEDQPYNRFRNGGPEFLGYIIRNNVPMTPNSRMGWGIAGSAAYAQNQNQDTHFYFHEIQIKVKETQPEEENNRYYQLQNAIIQNGNVRGGLDVLDLQDGDIITIAFDYKSTAEFQYYLVLDFKETNEDDFLRCADDRFDANSKHTLPASNDWKRITHTYTIPVGFSNLISNFPYLYTAIFLVQVYPQVWNSMHWFRHFSLYKGYISNYTSGREDYLFGGSRSSWIQAAGGATVANCANLIQRNTTQMFPVAAVKTPDGAWAQGSYGERYVFSYTLDANWPAANYAENYLLPIPATSHSGITNYNILTTKNVTYGTGDPSGGAEGDIYIKYV